MTQLLIIGYVWPEPDSSAAGSRMMQLIELFIAQGWSVTFASAALPSEHMADLKGLGVATAKIALNCASFDRFVGQVRPDIVIFDRFMIEEQFGWRVAHHCPDAIRVLDSEDLHCLRQARQRALEAGRELTTADLNADIALREVAAILRCDLSLIISDYEVRLLREHYGVAADLLWHLPFMLPTADPAEFASFEQRDGFVCIGNFRHAPNWDAVKYLKSVIWPLIRRRMPDAEVRVYGAYPPPKATHLNDPQQGFRVIGRAEDACAVMGRARICLAPLRFGAGLKGKLVEAMQCGTPSVTTSIGAESMHAALPWSGVIADEPETFAEQAVALHRSVGRWRQAQENGVAIINRLYRKDRLGDGLLGRLSAIRANLSAHRLANFTGAMLQHHTLQSTRYMAQWIEAKNKAGPRAD